MPKSNIFKPTNPSQFTCTHDDDDDFQTPVPSFPLTQTKPSNSTVNRPSKKRKTTRTRPGKENIVTPPEFEFNLGLDCIEPGVLCNTSRGCTPSVCENASEKVERFEGVSGTGDEKGVKLEDGFGYGLDSIESRLLVGSQGGCGLGVCENASKKEEIFEGVDEGVSGTGDEKGMKVKGGVGYVANSIESRLLVGSRDGRILGVCENVCEKEERFEGVSGTGDEKGMKVKGGVGYMANSIESRLLVGSRDGRILGVCENVCEKEERFEGVSGTGDEKGMKVKNGVGYVSKSIESRLLLGSRGVCENVCEKEERFEGGSTQLDVLLDLCCESEEKGSEEGDEFVSCPMCGDDISDLSDEMRQVHTNECLDKEQIDIPDNDHVLESSGQVLDDPPCPAPDQTHHSSPISTWLQNLGLSRYEEVFIREEIDWDSLKWLTDEDLCKIGITALGPRKKIVHAISELRAERHEEVSIPESIAQKETKTVTNKLITDFFPGFAGKVRQSCANGAQAHVGKTNTNNSNKRSGTKPNFSNKKFRDTPSWCLITGTPFRVDAFKYLRRDCSHWFLTHFHADHYGGLTKSFCHGKIYCSLITAKLVNLKIGIPWEKIEVLPLNQKINIAGVDVTCFDANHCPGAVIILFEPPNGKAILHTGDFRFSEDMTKISSLQTRVHTLVLDTTYGDPQYDFPKQESVIQYVLEAIQAEAFNPKTLFLIGSYTIGKERVFMEVARVLRKKIYVTAAKMRVLECLGMPKEDMQWLTLDERESHIHVVPMWTLANFKRLKHVSNMYMGRYSLIVAFSPTGWSFTKGKKSSPGTGKRWQQGTIIRYEVPYSEHSSFTELKEFVKFISPEQIIPSVNNYGPESVNKMVSLLSF